LPELYLEYREIDKEVKSKDIETKIVGKGVGNLERAFGREDGIIMINPARKTY